MKWSQRRVFRTVGALACCSLSGCSPHMLKTYTPDGHPGYVIDCSRVDLLAFNNVGDADWPACEQQAKKSCGGAGYSLSFSTRGTSYASGPQQIADTEGVFVISCN